MGMAGSGKSTLARSIASQISDAGYPVGSFFFSASEPARSGIGRVAATVASQLAILSTVVRSRVSEALKHGCDAVTNKKFDKQWELLIQEPVQSALECFSQVSRGQRGTGRELHHDVPIIFVIFDALDECEGGMVSQLIETLVRSSQALRGKGICLRILLTSRNEEALPLDDESAAEPPRWVLGDQPREEVEADLRVFYKSRLEEVQMERQQRVKRRRGRPQKPAGSSQRIPDDELDSLITRLVALSDHHFLHAEIACRIISGTGDDLKSSVTAFLEDSSTPGLDAVYLLALQRALLNEHRLTQEQRCRRFRLLAGMSVVAFEQLTLQNLSALSKASDTAETFTDDIEDFLFSLSAILHVPEQNGVAVRFVHLSFREFVLDSERCKDERFQVKPEDAHAAMFLGCLAVLDPPRTALSGGLHRNLGRLRSPVDHPYEQYSEDLLAQRRKRLLKYGLLSYSCRFWIAHLCRCTVTTDQLDIVCRFLERKSLEWIEALFWFYELVNVVSWLSSLDGLAKDIGNSTLQDLAFDLSVLIRENFYLIDKAPLQVYFMASLMASSKVMDKHRFLNNIHTGARLYRSPPANGSRLEFLDKRNVYLPVDHLIVLSNSRVNPFVTVKGGVLGTSLYLDGLGLPYRARQLEVIDNPTAGRFTPDGRYVVLGNAESTCVVDVRLQRVFSTSVVEKGWDFRGMVFSPEATTCVAWGSYEAMRAHHRPAQPSLAVWSTFNVRNSESNNPSTDQKLINRDVVPRRLDMPEEVLAVVHSTDGERLAVRLVSGAIIILDTEAYRKMESWECGDHQDDNNPMVPWATAMSMAPIGDDYHLAIFDGNRVQIWSAANRALLRTLDITGRSNWDGSSESLVVRYTRPLHSAEYDALMAIGARDSKDDDAYLGWSPEEDSASPLVVWETQSYSLLHLLHLNDHGFKYDISGNLDVLVSYRHDQDIKERAERTTTWGLRDHLFTNRSTCTQAAKVIRFPETPCRLPRFECIALSPKDQVAILTGNNEIWVWGFAAGSTARRLPCSFVNPNWDPGSDSWGADWWFAFSADEKRFAAVRDSHLAEWWDLEDETRCGTCRTKAAIHRISFDEEGVIQLLTDVISERDDGQGNDDRESSSNVAQRDASLGVPTTQKSIECAEPADVAGIERNVAIDTELSDGAVTDLEAKIRVEDDIFLVGGVALFRLPEYTALPRRRGYFLSDMSSTSEGTGTDAIAWQDRRTLEVFVVVGLSALARLWQEMPSDRGDDTPTPG
ncbi:hypothetical protein N658DRAFT_94964 [Parathielavia hyrcaniae]|uniref:Nephrocystin 3-like N-terminal domain-containing protein n=1 Tax=Parathielavia hyrcaniae TaxID=113614 RepID=A0AAN6SWV2_9PEZI|nr:hypothetical protein N658DRAFT_94964 [Parathielavia hyrcaniae]